MKKIIMILFGACAFLSLPLNAQRLFTEVNPQKVAEMLIAEKRSGKVDDAPFVTYLDSLGFTRRPGGQYVREYINKRGKTIPVEVFLSYFDKERLFKMCIDDDGSCWWFFIKLKAFGLKGPNATAKGKGLKASAGRMEVRLGYDIIGDKD